MSLQIGMNYFPIKDVLIENKNFKNSFNALRIVQLSDLHLNKRVSLDYLEKLVDEVNQIDPHIVVITGDILQTKAINVKEHLSIFKKFRSKVYFVTGNHDMYYGVKELKKEMSDNGLICMDNKIEILRHVDNSAFQLVGLSDRYSLLRGIKRHVKELFSKLDSNLPTILLAHQPKDIYKIGSNRIDVQLSGHTHGGQIYPFSMLVKVFQPYFSGLYTYNKTLLYVNNGLGYWGVNIRYKAKSEIAVLTIN